MSKQGNETHICKEHLGAGCRCTICGKICHDYHSDDDGTFAASGKVVTARCARCGDEEHYYADTGVVIEHYRGRSYEREPETVYPSKHAPQGELLYMIKKSDDRYIITGITERSVAEKLGLRHLTVIIVPFVTDGADKGCWIIHNRHDKQIAKGKTSAPLSLNLFGGHCGPPEDDIARLIGKTVGPELLRENALRELSEELLCKNGMKKRLELWRDGVFAGEFLYASPYEVCPESLIPIGFTEYAAKDNVEYSYIFALPVPGSQVEQIIAADNYDKHSQADGITYETDIALPVVFMTESELKRLWESRDPQVEVCDAITRLWEEQNRAVYQRLLDCIETHEVF
ncbi:MAG: hypothetical protein ACC608_01935 [Anaerofustis sp.]